MKKFLSFTILLTFAISTATSQVIQKAVPVTKKNVTIKTVPPPPPAPASAPPPASTNKSTGTNNQPTLVYTLTAVKANIKTGADNKEYPSNNLLRFLFA